MSFQKTLVSGSLGSVSVSEDAGKVTLSGSLSASLGGGEAAGVASVSGSVGVTVSAKQLIDLGLELAEAKFPSAASFIKAAQEAIDAEMAKI